ncbi:MAG: hypothetical protein AAF958_15620, partial [Planctomycetota bacterium]
MSKTHFFTGRRPIAARSTRPFLRLVLVATLIGGVAADSSWGQLEASPSKPDQAKRDQAALEIYADAANLQNGGAPDLAIEEWQKFLKQHAKHPKAAEAAHYMGVCHMQTDPP